jgi:hypothetical protein
VNLGIILFTLLRLVTLSSAIYLLVMVIIMPSFMGMASRIGHSDVSDYLTPTLFNSVLPLVGSFIIVADNVANSKNLNDGEYLSLLFTRPVSRSSYIFSKWLAGTVGVTICVFIAYASYLVSANMVGNALLPDPLELANILLNSASAVALVVLVSTVPMRLGVFLLAILFYTSSLGPIFTSVNVKATAVSQTPTVLVMHGLGSILTFLQSLVHLTLDLREMCDAVTFSWTPVVCYLSNLAIYLLLAIVIMNRREFYYASE